MELVFDKNCGIDELRKILRIHINEVNKKEEQERIEREELLGSINEDNESRITHTMADGNNTRLEFQLRKDDWETYTERLELYFVANDVKVKKQAAVLLTKISPKIYKLVCVLCTPDKPSTKSFAEIVKLIKKHLNPKPSETMERCKFYQTQQAATKSVAEFSARLKKFVD